MGRGQSNTQGSSQSRTQGTTATVDAPESTERGVTAAEKQRRKQAETKLQLKYPNAGVRVPPIEIEIDYDTRESVGTYFLSEEGETNFSILRNTLESGDRAHIITGATGSGKSRFVQEVAALRFQPYVRIPVDGIGDARLSVSVGGQVATLSMPKEHAELLRDALVEDTVIELEERGADLQGQANLQAALGSLLKEGNGAIAIDGEEQEVSVNPESLVFFTHPQALVDDPRQHPDARRNLAPLNLTGGHLNDKEWGQMTGAPNTREVDAWLSNVSDSYNRDGIDAETTALATKINERLHKNEDLEGKVTMDEDTAEQIARFGRRLNAAREEGLPIAEVTEEDLTRFGVTLAAQGFGGDDYPVDTSSIQLRSLFDARIGNFHEQDRVIRHFILKKASPVLEGFAAEARKARTS